MRGERRQPAGTGLQHGPGAALSSLPSRLEVERERPLGDLAPQDEAVLARRAEVDASVDPGVRALPRRLRDARERALDIWEGRPTRDRKGDLVGAEDARECYRRRAAEEALG